MAEPVEVGLELGEDARGQPPAKVRAEERVVVELIAEPRWLLKELGHRVVCSPPVSDTHPVRNLPSGRLPRDEIP